MQKKLNLYRKTALILAVLIFAPVWTSCAAKSDEIKKVADMEFTVVKEADIPERLKTIISEKKSAPFKLTYSDGEYLYIARGYGPQAAGSYSIRVNEVWLAENAVYFECELSGTDEKTGTTNTNGAVYPYIVVKIEQTELPVVFN